MSAKYFWEAICMLKKFLGLFALIVIMATALVFYSMNTELPDVTGAVDAYKQQAFDKTKEVAAPVLKEAGIDVEKVPTSTDDLNVVKQQMQEASDKVNEATQVLTQSKD